MLAASRSWVMTFENASSLGPGLSDAICRLSTGGGLSKRALYTDDDEVVLDCTRPVIITSIEEIASRPDLLDRAVLVEMIRLEKQSRMTERFVLEGVRRSLFGDPRRGVRHGRRRAPGDRKRADQGTAPHGGFC
jgi:hypothetical protein